MGTALCFGLYSTHIFVPPTPGPIAAAGALGADLGTVIGIGLVVAIPACLAGLLWALWAGRRFAAKKPLPAEYEDVIAEPDHLPRALSSFLPLVVPILLIALRSVSTTIELPTQLVTLRNGLGFLGQPALALLIGVFLAMRLAPRGNRDVFGSWIRHAMGESATTLAVTGAGGAFGAVLAATGMAQYLGTALAQYRVGLLLPFLIAAAIKTAQGSSTVAQATGAAIVVPMLGALGLVAPMGRVLAVMAVSAGAMVVLHANGSYFWVITQLTDMDVREGYLLVTLGTLVVGVVSFLTILALSLILL
jgi:GntP family gluconate:H+ symporter